MRTRGRLIVAIGDERTPGGRSGARRRRLGCDGELALRGERLRQVTSDGERSKHLDAGCGRGGGRRTRRHRCATRRPRSATRIVRARRSTIVGRLTAVHRVRAGARTHRVTSMRGTQHATSQQRKLQEKHTRDRGNQSLEKWHDVTDGASGARSWSCIDRLPRRPRVGGQVLSYIVSGIPEHPKDNLKAGPLPGTSERTSHRP